MFQSNKQFSEMFSQSDWLPQLSSLPHTGCSAQLLCSASENVTAKVCGVVVCMCVLSAVQKSSLTGHCCCDRIMTKLVLNPPTHRHSCYSVTSSELLRADDI